MNVISFLQEYQQTVLFVGVLLAGVVLYSLLTRKSREMEALEREYQEIVQSGSPVRNRSLAAKAEE